MLYCVEMDVVLPHGIDPEYVAKLKADEKARAQDLQREGRWVHLWRVAGRYANVSIFDVESHDALHDILSSLPLFPFMTIRVTPLARHPSAIA
ncbi:muconolactone Delta-isomerase [Methylobacterium sp. ID0610]|uniref:muconolactone Delta-isomerase n=1 Tax=Methylobacterium carpenticola TaxID=3344827 RepID=UPI0036C07823